MSEQTVWTAAEWQAKEALKEDARNRFDRTFWQGLGIDVLVAFAVAVYAIATSPEPIVWAVVGASLARTLVQAAAAYVMRLFIDGKSGVLLPPKPTPEPAEPAEQPYPNYVPGGIIDGANPGPPAP